MLASYWFKQNGQCACVGGGGGGGVGTVTVAVVVVVVVVVVGVVAVVAVAVIVVTVVVVVATAVAVTAAVSFVVGVVTSSAVFPPPSAPPMFFLFLLLWYFAQSLCTEQSRRHFSAWCDLVGFTQMTLHCSSFFPACQHVRHQWDAGAALATRLKDSAAAAAAPAPPPAPFSVGVTGSACFFCFFFVCDMVTTKTLGWKHD